MNHSNHHVNDKNSLLQTSHRKSGALTMQNDLFSYLTLMQEWKESNLYFIEKCPFDHVASNCMSWYASVNYLSCYDKSENNCGSIAFHLCEHLFTFLQRVNNVSATCFLSIFENTTYITSVCFSYWISSVSKVFQNSSKKMLWECNLEISDRNAECSNYYVLCVVILL